MLLQAAAYDGMLPVDELLRLDVEVEIDELRLSELLVGERLDVPEEPVLDELLVRERLVELEKLKLDVLLRLDVEVGLEDELRLDELLLCEIDTVAGVDALDMVG
jgi:hypothetical protein